MHAPSEGRQDAAFFLTIRVAEELETDAVLDPKTRTLTLKMSLLTGPPQQLAMVLGHEVGHMVLADALTHMKALAHAKEG